MAFANYNDPNSTLQMPTSTVKTVDLNLDHDIAGEFEDAIDHSKLESKHKYDFMNFGGTASVKQYSPFTAEQQSAIRPANNWRDCENGNRIAGLRATGSIMGDVESRDSSFMTIPQYN